jgi:hypothetical protein
VSIMNFRYQDVMSPRQRELKSLLDLSEQVLSFAELGDWGSAVKLQRHRRASMEEFFAQGCSAGESEQVASVIKYILDIDQQVSDVLYGYRNKLVQESGLASRNIRQLDNYISNSL